MYYLYGSLTSPYVRICRIMAKELGEALNFTKVDVVKQPETVSDKNPLRQVPVLMHDGQTVLDSRMICQYMLRTAKSVPREFRAEWPLSTNEENVLSVIYGALDECILSFHLKRDNADIEQKGGAFDRMQRRIRDGFSWLEREASKNEPHYGQKFGVAEALTMSAMEWVKVRDVFDWSDFQVLSNLYEKFQDRPSVVATNMPTDHAKSPDGGNKKVEV